MRLDKMPCARWAARNDTIKGKLMTLRSQKLRQVNAQSDSLKLGMGWSPEDLAKPQILVESCEGETHPSSYHLGQLAEEVRNGLLSRGMKPVSFSPPIFATASPRATKEWTSACLHAKSWLTWLKSTPRATSMMEWFSSPLATKPFPLT